MTIDWFKLAAAVVLLLVPIALFHGAKVRYRPIARDWNRHWLQALTLGSHTIDLGRAALGGWLLAEAIVAQPDARGLMRVAPVLIDGAVFTIAVVLQTVVCRERDSFHAPFTFVAGLLFGFFSDQPSVPGFAFVMAAAVTIGARVPTLYFPLLAGSAVASCRFFSGALSLPALAIACAIVLPPIIAVMFRRPLMVSYRAKRQLESRAPLVESEQPRPDRSDRNS